MDQETLSARVRHANSISARIASRLKSDHWDTICNAKPYSIDLEMDGVVFVVYAPQAVTGPAGERGVTWASLYMDPRAQLEWRCDVQIAVIGSSHV